MMVVVDSGYFYAGLVIEGDRITRAPPILAYSRRMGLTKFLEYAKRKGWEVTIVESSP